MIIFKENKSPKNEGKGSSAGYKIWNETFVKRLNAAGWVPKGYFADLDFLRDEFVEFLQNSSDALGKQAIFLKSRAMTVVADRHFSALPALRCTDFHIQSTQAE